MAQERISAETVWGVQVKCKGKTTWFTTLARGPWDARRKILQWIGLEASDTPYRVLQVREKPYG